MMQQENIRAISLSEMGENSTGNIAKIEGDSRFISRIIYTAHVRRQVRNIQQRIAARELRNRRDNVDCAIHL